MKFKTFLFRLFLFVVAGGFLVFFLPQVTILWNARNKILEIQKIPEAPVAIVFGASVVKNTYPSAVLADRVASAAELYLAQKVDKLLMTGDGIADDYSEVNVMKAEAMAFDVAEGNILLDPEGLSTFDSCTRAGKVFGIEKAILVTQEFHLPRAIYLCEKAGIESWGYASDRQGYAKIDFFEFREFFARMKAFFEINLPFFPLLEGA